MAVTEAATKGARATEVVTKSAEAVKEENRILTKVVQGVETG